MSWLDFSSDAFLVAFFLYCFGFLFYAVAVAGRKWSKRKPEDHLRRWGRIAFIVSLLGFISHLAFFITRWIGGGHIPTSNMYEFMTFLAMAIMFAFIIVNAIYRSPLLGMFTLPLTVIIVAYAAVFPQEVQPLIPALNHYWLKIHVTTAALGEAFFAVGFAAGLMYLLRTVDFKKTDAKSRRDQRWIEFTLFVIVIIIAFIGTVFAFRGADYKASFRQEMVTIDSKGIESTTTETVEYTMPPIFKPYNSENIQVDSFLGMKEPLFETPSWMHGVNAARKLNTIVWSVLTGSILYGLIRLALRRRLGAAIHPIMDGIDQEDLDEISYRAIAIGYPIFTLGALIFAMIWAYIAWSRFWGWDPKEVWALITWLYYTAYLHLRLSRGWHGAKSAWLAVIGFVVVMFTLIGVNLVLVGLHSYAGV
ncbi:Cytochrome c biogenesis protein CcsA [Paenibacillus plantiphilus]|uniref:Cytochrome c biogenesis protein CcsA n=1 Tax=Paenibacillus plantiphilus TaxID=2905650 RepID=A0ABM9CDB8_9BACL|nr:cytochrome c biogenesis protein CcsA [Paenibacillus plantiphilus]CAH1210506.1 Cytochrome c biogenesis protein CcsA [Paenibacillus plantiphilus]